MFEENNFKIVYKKVIDYDKLTNSSISSSSSSSSNSSNSPDSITQNNNNDDNNDNENDLYIKNISNSKKIIEFDNKSQNKDKVKQNEQIKQNSNEEILNEINLIIKNIDNIQDKNGILNYISEYLKNKNYSEDKNKLILSELKKYIENYTKINIKQEQNSNIDKDIDNDFNLWIFYCAIFITFIIVIMVFIKKF